MLLNHGVPASLVAAHFAFARSFFALDLTRKRAIDVSRSNCFRGYPGYDHRVACVPTCEPRHGAPRFAARTVAEHMQATADATLNGTDAIIGERPMR